VETPIATYRVQLHKDFGFHKLTAVLPYLAELGVSHIYSSPIFKAKKGSSHGYDIVDPNSISDELGGERGFEEANKSAEKCGLRWIQDIVPNHAAYSLENQMILDLMRNGSASNFYNFYDVDWAYPSYWLKGKIMVPFLEEPYIDCLEQRKIQLVGHGGEFAVKYQELEFPLLEGSCPALSNANTEAQIEKTLRAYNNNTQRLDALLSCQVYSLHHWKTALKQINYRRFFDIIDLIGVRNEDSTVFEATHQLIFRLLQEGKIAGVRVDHIDGLNQPEVYLEKLRNIQADAYVVVEKILGEDEQLPNTWPVQGTTGYDFLNQLNSIFVEKIAEENFIKLYQRFTKRRESFGEILYDSRKKIIQMSFASDINNLARLLELFLHKKPYSAGCTNIRFREALTEVFACFPVYRTYIAEGNCGTTVSHYFQEALREAKQRNSKIHKEINAMEQMLTETLFSSEALKVVMRIQQFTGAVMAKGFEDTALYLYCQLLSLNEVGGNPATFGKSKKNFHTFNKTRQRNWPLSLNTTTTHDTKRAEDARARLNTLSEIPDEFAVELEKWKKINKYKKTLINHRLSPDRNEEYFIYQTLLGAFPFDIELEPDFSNRIKSYLIKALREAKCHSSWLSPKNRYEDAVTDFVTALLNLKQGADFLQLFLPFQKKIAYFGALNSLAQVLLKLTSPGIPDFYQGTELWDLSLVDPDNRRPVNYAKRQQILKQAIQTRASNAAELLEHFSDGEVKLYVTHKLLRARKNNMSLFNEGIYVPLEVKGVHAHHVIAFYRKKGNQYSLSVASRFLTNLLKPFSSPQNIMWKNTYLHLPPYAPKKWVDSLTEKVIHTDGNLAVSEILSDFPIALLTTKEP